MVIIKITLTLLLATQLVFLSASSIGSITGLVIDADTHQPLIGANVMLLDTELGCASNTDGKCSVANIPVGSYTISISMIGYESISRANVNIYSQRQTPLKFYLHTAALQGETVKVTAGFFEKAKDGIVSTQTIGIEEIRSDPVGVYDIQMMVHALPSVVTATDQNNEIIVRGGAGPNAGHTIKDGDKVYKVRMLPSGFLNKNAKIMIGPGVVVNPDVLKKEIEDFYPHSENINENYVQIVNERNFNRLAQLIPTDKIYHGGEVNPENRSIAPTLLRNIGFEDHIMQDEIFGPILPIIAFENLEDVIKKVKEKEKPLSLYIYSINKKVIKKILHEISFGGGAINESLVQMSNPNLPFGGVGASGIGNYHSKTGFDTFTHYKSILHKTSWLEPNIKYTPFTELKSKILKFLLE